MSWELEVGFFWELMRIYGLEGFSIGNVVMTSAKSRVCFFIEFLWLWLQERWVDWLELIHKFSIFQWSSLSFLSHLKYRLIVGNCMVISLGIDENSWCWGYEERECCYEGCEIKNSFLDWSYVIEVARTAVGFLWSSIRRSAILQGTILSFFSPSWCSRTSILLSSIFWWTFGVNDFVSPSSSCCLLNSLG